MTERLIALSKTLAYVLRHRPDAVGVELDDEGWVGIDDLLTALNAAGHTISSDDLTSIIEQSAKKRYQVRAGRIRAAQGHSVEVDLGLDPSVPPDVLYHGTVGRFLPNIRREGLVSGSRVHVHLSGTRETAIEVGGRRGKPRVLTVAAGRMHSAGHEFFLASNGVWLTEHVPPEYLSELGT